MCRDRYIPGVWEDEKMKKWQIRACAAVFPLLLMVAAALLAAPVYYLNDDVTMRSILSGACTGVPDGHAVYMKYPLTGLLAVLYRLTGKGRIFVPWFDLFLTGCILLAGAGILANCLEAAQGKKSERRRRQGFLERCSLPDYCCPITSICIIPLSPPYWPGRRYFCG